MDINGIDEAAPVISRQSAVIVASIENLWRLHTDINGWPSWQKAIDRAHLEGAFQTGARFLWETYKLTIASTVYQVEPHRHTLWGGPSEGITGIHSWTFTQVDGAVRVDTAESWSGDPVTADVANMQAALDGSLTAWLGYLRDAAQPLR